MPAVLSRFCILFISNISCDRDNTKILAFNLFFQCLVVKPASVIAALVIKKGHGNAVIIEVANYIT